MRADGLPFIPPCPVCRTDTPRFLTVGLVSWAIKCRDKDCGFKLKHEQESVLRDLWARLQPAEVDPIAELEAIGGRLFACVTRLCLYWSLGERFEDIPAPIGGSQIADIRAAAARLVAQVKAGAQ